MTMRRRLQPALVTFRNHLLSVPGYTFEPARPWVDTGSATLLAQGISLKDGSNVLAKIAPSHSGGSLCLEREAHILGQLAVHQDATRTTLRMIDFFTVPRDQGDSVVLLLTYPGRNMLGRYFPRQKVNELLLSNMSSPSRSHVDTPGGELDSEPELTTEDPEQEAPEVMDLATFLEFGVQATHCLEVIHKAGIVHREVRANAFHLNTHSGLLRLAHFGNRSISLEHSGGPSQLVILSEALDEIDKLHIKEALCYLAPEQTGSIETSVEDGRTDLYALGILFWTLLVGRGVLPFEGPPLELLHAIVQKHPMQVHEVRRDVPRVLALIIEKLLAKNPEHRYQSAIGLKADLMQCQRSLLTSVSMGSEQGDAELIPMFEIGLQDRYLEFTLPSILYGREKELETIRNVIRHVSNGHSRPAAGPHFLTATGTGGSHHSTSAGGRHNDEEMSVSSHEDSTREAGSDAVVSPIYSTAGELSRSSATSPAFGDDAKTNKGTNSSPSFMGSDSAINTSMFTSTSAVSNNTSNDELRRLALAPSKPRVARARTVIVVGDPGAGKSSLIQANQAKWRTHGLWGHAKFHAANPAPFAALMACLSSVLRQLIAFSSDLHRFVTTLRSRLGPQVHNVPLLYRGAPELQYIFNLYNIETHQPGGYLTTQELRARFQALMLEICVVLAETRLFAIFLDDIHEADDSSLELIVTLANSKSRLLLLTTLRTDYPAVEERIRTLFLGRSRVVWLRIEPLAFPAIASLVSRVLRQPKEECTGLAHFIYSVSHGNAFSARNYLYSLYRQHQITYDSDRNYWRFDLNSIQSTLNVNDARLDPNDPSFLTAHFRQLPEDAQRFLLWASFFGATFKVADVSLMVDWDYSSGSSGSGEESEDVELSRMVTDHREKRKAFDPASMRGLQEAIQEGWLIQRARDMCSFAHDRYRTVVESEASMLPNDAMSKMAFRIILMLLHDALPDVHSITRHAKSCLPLIREHSKREELLDLLVDAAQSSLEMGAHELALSIFIDARQLLPDNPWKNDHGRTMIIMSKMAELYTWKGQGEESEVLSQECFENALNLEDKARALRMRSSICWMRNQYSEGLGHILAALKVLGIKVNPAPTRTEADAMFDEVKDEILQTGIDKILTIPAANNDRVDLVVALLAEAGTHAYWSSGEGFVDVIGLTIIQHALRFGMSPGTGMGMFWALGAAAEQREMYCFSRDLAKLAIKIADLHGTNTERCRVAVLSVALVSGFNDTHVKLNKPRLEHAIKLGYSAGDRIYTVYGIVHHMMTRLFMGEHLSEVVPAAEESISDINVRQSAVGDAMVLCIGVLNCMRALAGLTRADYVHTAFDTETFIESEYLAHAISNTGNMSLVLNWYNGFKVAALFCLGYTVEAADLGFYVYNTRTAHPNHRHIRYALFFHSLALIACVRAGNLSATQRASYLDQVELNQAYMRKWLNASPVNNATWIALVDAELASLRGSSEALKLYDVAVKLAIDTEWPLEEGWALYLQGSHLIRDGVDGLGGELQRRGIVQHARWGARGIVVHLSKTIKPESVLAARRTTYTASVAVQTENVLISDQAQTYGETVEKTDEDDLSSLSAVDLASVIRWSKDISSDINLTSALSRLTEIAAEHAGSQNTCVVIAREGGDYTVATSITSADRSCQIYEKPVPVRSIEDVLQRAVIQQVLNTKERLNSDDVTSDPRFMSEAQSSLHRAIICLPIRSFRGQMFGVLYLASRYAFSPHISQTLALLCQQASISVANALLFRSVQAGTRENLKMIAAQRDALDVARHSREEAVKATKTKSRFLASMSHELRTPFSSFYGLLDILDGTPLNAGQRDLVQTAKQSCDLLLKIIDSILDYSKLEADAVKLEMSGFPVENILADCLELLLPSAAKKLDLSFDIEPSVPAWITADYTRIRQILMNLIGNAVKFTASGFVKVVCSSGPADASGRDISLKFAIQDTGIGLSRSEVDLLFVPFQQADNSSTRRFGGTGLGLSISRQLVKLQGGDIDVHSELGVGSTFWFTIPVTRFESEESRQALNNVHALRMQLTTPTPPRIWIISPSDATRKHLSTLLYGFSVTTFQTVLEVESYLKAPGSDLSPLDFAILDDQSDERANYLARQFASGTPVLEDTKLIHLYTPTADRGPIPMQHLNNDPHIFKMTKPPRQLRLLQTLAALNNLPEIVPRASQATGVSQAMEALAAASRTLFGNVLVAEDNPIAQKVLVTQLKRFDLNVFATSNGEEAITEWMKHPAGFFSLAVFDHHMPILDGVEASKRLRMLERDRRDEHSIPIVALSADAQESTKQLCLSAGMNGFFIKPLKKGDLLTLISGFGTPLLQPDPS